MSLSASFEKREVKSLMKSECIWECEDVLFEMHCVRNGCSGADWKAVILCRNSPALAGGQGNAQWRWNVVDAHDGFVAHKFLGLFYQLADVAACIGDGYAKTAGVSDSVGVEDVARSFDFVCVSLRMTR